MIEPNAQNGMLITVRSIDHGMSDGWIESQLTYSVVVPVYNESETIEQCLDSLLTTGIASSRLEILVVDGMSEDRTPQIVGDYAAKHEPIELLENPNRTTPSGLNIGFEKSENDVITLISGHSHVDSNFFEHLTETFTERAPEADVVGGQMMPVGETYTEQSVATALATPIGSSSSRFEPIEGYVETVNFGAYRREVIEVVGHMDTELPRTQDYEYNRRVREHGYRIYQNPSIRVYYSPRSSYQGLTRQYFGNGFWKTKVFRMYNDYPLKPRTFLLIGGLAMAGIVIILPPLLPMIVTAITAYLLFLWYTAIKTVSHRSNYLILLPGVVASLIVMHISFVIGFLWGTIDEPGLD